MGRHFCRQFIPAAFIGLWLAVSSFGAETVIYNDGTWVVSGVDATNSSPDHIAVSVGGQPVGQFAELRAYRSSGGGVPPICSIQASGGLQPTVPPGVLGGTFYLTGYWDCYTGAQLDLHIIALNIQPNTKSYKTLNFTGTLSNGTSLQASDFSLKLSLPNDNTVRLDVSYTLYAISNLCIDPYRQQAAEGFQAARIASTYLSSEFMDNDGARAKGVIGSSCDCCGCSRSKAYICANFVNVSSYVFPYPVYMADSQLLMLHWQVGPQNSPALRITTKNPSKSNCSVQGYSIFSTDPTNDNVTVWVNWDTAKSQYSAGQKVRKFRFYLEALLPTSESCDIVVQPPPP